MSDEQKYLDERLEAALEKAKYKFTLTLQRKNAALKFKQALTYSQNGGTFNVTEALISFVGTLISRGQSEAVLIDVNSNPIQIDDIETFLDEIINCYYEAANDYLVEFKTIRSARNVAPALEW
jgi:hypothetical protein